MSNTKTITLKYKDDIRLVGERSPILYTLDEILLMEDVREDEKQSCIRCNKEQDVIGFVEIKTRPYKLFLDVNDKEVLKS